MLFRSVAGSLFDAGYGPSLGGRSQIFCARIRRAPAST
jgi:hypothetical protein